MCNAMFDQHSASVVLIMAVYSTKRKGILKEFTRSSDRQNLHLIKYMLCVMEFLCIPPLDEY